MKSGSPNRQITLNILDNPIWQSLSTCHSNVAIGGEQAKRYPSAIGPFIAVASSDSSVEAELAALTDIGESLFIVGIAPSLGADWKVEEKAPIAQMICSSRPKPVKSDTEFSVLTEADIPAMLALTSLVYPEFFRSRTSELGTYLGVYQNSPNKMLAAMAGERMHLTGYREISAVCTHPNFTGLGLAQLLIAQLVNAIFDRHEVPFLHVSSNNERAKSLYEHLGFTTRCEIPLWLIERQR